MSDLISKEKIRHEIAMLIMNNNSLIDTWLANCIDDIIDEQPTIEAEPKHGRWETPIGYPNVLLCSECATPYEKKEFVAIPNYCPYCGADMRESRNDNHTECE